MAGLVIFSASLAFLLYVLIGYPLLLAWLARRRGKPVCIGPSEAPVSILLPVRDGERWIAAKLDSILRLDYPRSRLQIVVVSDGSLDRTEQIVRSYQGRGIELLCAPRLGKPSAINLGLQRCRGDIVVFTDVRQELAPDALKILAACLTDPSVAVVSGELVIRDGTSREEADVGLYWRYEKWIRRQLSLLDSITGATGCLYAMRREHIESMPADILVDDMYLPVAAFLRGYRVVLADAKAYDEPTLLATEFRRKVRTLAGVYQMIGYFPALIGPRNRMWLHFVSHKLGRLLLPWALLAAAGATFAMPWWAAVPAGIAQAAFYGIAALDGMIAQRSRWKRLSSPARTFVVLMTAALCAASILFRDPRSFWPAPTAPAKARGAAA